MGDVLFSRILDCSLDSRMESRSLQSNAQRTLRWEVSQDALCRRSHTVGRGGGGGIASAAWLWSTTGS